jgi:hypothetical protein
MKGTKIKQFLILFAFVSTYQIGLAQTPYDDFAPDKKKKEMLKLPETTFRAYNSDTNGKIKYIELDKETLALSYYDGMDSVLMQIFLKPTDFKWLSIDPMSGKYAGMSPYMFVRGNPIFYYESDGRDSWVAIKAAHDNEAGHTVMLADNYVLVPMNINGQNTIMYRKEGFVFYENNAYSSNTSNTNIRSDYKTIGQVNSNISSYDGAIQVYETGKGQMINGVEYFTQSQVQTELNVYQKSQELKENKENILPSGEKVSANTYWDIKQYSCADYVSDLLVALGYSNDIGNTTVQQNGSTYTKKTPNKVFIDIMSMNKKPLFMKSNVTVQNAKDYINYYLNQY